MSGQPPWRSTQMIARLYPHAATSNKMPAAKCLIYTKPRRADPRASSTANQRQKRAEERVCSPDKDARTHQGQDERGKLGALSAMGGIGSGMIARGLQFGIRPRDL